MKKKLSFIFTLLVLSSFSWAVKITSYYKPATAPAAQMSQMRSVVFEAGSLSNVAEVEMADYVVSLASMSGQLKQSRNALTPGDKIAGAVSNNGSANGIWTSVGKKNTSRSIGVMMGRDATVSANAIHTATAQNGPTTTYDIMNVTSGPRHKATRPTDDPIGGLAPVGDAVLPLALLALAFAIVLTIRRKADRDAESEKSK